MSAAGIRAGKAYVELFADPTKLNAGLKSAQERLKKFGADLRQAGTTMGIAGAAMVSPFLLAINEFRSAAKGGFLPPGMMRDAERLAGSTESAKEALRQLGVSVGAILAPSMARLSDRLADTTAKTKEWAEANPTAAKSVYVLSGAVAALGASLVAIGIGASMAGFAIAGFGTVLKGSIAAINLAKVTVVSLFAAMRAAAIATTLTFSLGGIGGLAAGFVALVNPITLVTAAAVGLGYVVMRNTESGRAYLNSLADGFKELKDDASTAWTGIVDTLASGDLFGAVAIAWQFIKTEFVRGWQSIQEIGWGFGAGIMKGFTYLAEWVAKAWSSAASFISSTLTRISGWISELQGGAAVLGSAIAEGVGVVNAGTTDQVIRDAAERFTDGEASRAKELARIADDSKRRWEDIGDGADGMRAAINDGLAELLTDNRESIEDMRARLKEMADAAKGPGKGPTAQVVAGFDGAGYLEDAAGLGDMERARFDLIEEFTKRQDALSEKIANIQPPRADVFGTFSTAAAFGIGLGATAQDRTAKASEQAVKELQGVRQELARLNGTTFTA